MPRATRSLRRIRPRLRKSLLKPAGRSGGLYFDNIPQVKCISSGCRLLDRVLGGGWASGRVANIVGDKSTGKSLAAIELCANFAIKYPKGKGLIRYREAEAAFDEAYAECVGLPPGRVDFNKKRSVETVEDFYEDLEEFCDRVEGVEFAGYVEIKTLAGKKKTVRKTKPKKGAKKSAAGLYILDSLDAIGDDAENAEAFGKDSFGGKKPKLMGQLFRRIVRRLERLNVTLFIVSQTRDKIGVAFGDKLTRSGGKALDFYASQILWLADLGKIEENKGGVKRKVGAWVRAKCKKNKVGLAWRECDFPLRYAFGIDDFDAALNWLIEVKMLDRMGLSKEKAKDYLKALDKMEPEQVADEKARLDKIVDEAWWEVERRFLPRRKKYQ